MYLIWTFAIAWIMQAGVSVLCGNGHTMAGQLLLAVMMFVPLLGVLLSGHKLTGMGWKPHIRGNVRTLLIAWFVPAFLTAAGAALYFLAFPGHFDISGNYLAAAGGAEALKQLERQGLTYPLYILTAAIGSLAYAPFINMFFAAGEEVGWRGFLYPQLKSKFGRRKGGMLTFCIFTTAVGILCDWLYEKSNIIWIPSICHGAINAAVAIPLTVCLTNTGSMKLLGPAPVGVLAGLPFILSAAVLFLKSARKA